MLKGDRAHGLWGKTAPAPPATRTLDRDLSVDVAVVGAGFTGLSAALHLAQHGTRSLVLEAAGIGHGAAGRSSGLVNAGMWVAPDDVVAALGTDYGERLLQVLGEAPRFVCDLIEKQGIACELERSGTLQCAVGRAGLRTIRVRAEQLIRRGAAVDTLDAAATARMVGSSFYDGALLDRRTATVQPLAYVRGLASAATSAGAQIYTDSPVLAVERAGTGWRVCTIHGTVRTEWIIVATDAYTSGPWTEVRREIIQLPYFNIATEPLVDRVLASVLPEKQGVTDTRTVLSSIRLDQTGRLIIGSIGALRGAGTRIHTAWAQRAVTKLFPQVGDCGIEYAWYGSIGMTRTHLPMFHRLAPQVLSVSGYNGRGIAAGTIFGHLLAQLILGGISESDVPLPLSEPTEATFRSLRSLYYEAGARAWHFIDART